MPRTLPMFSGWGAAPLCAKAEPPPGTPVLPAASRSRAGGGEPCPGLAGAVQECAGLEQAAARGRGLRLAARAAAVVLHALLLLLVVFLESLPAPVLLDAPLVCTLDLDAVLPGVPESAPVAAAPVPQPEPQPAPRPKPKPRPAPKPVPEEAPVSTRESSAAKAPAPTPEPAPAAESALAAAPAPAAAVPEARAGRTGDQGRTSRGYELSQVDRAPRLTHKFTPEYPYAARSRNISGQVTVRFLVEEDGAVAEITVLSAEPAGVFEHSVLKAVRRWRFKPGERDGRPVPTWVVLPVRFDLTG